MLTLLTRRNWSSDPRRFENSDVNFRDGNNTGAAGRESGNEPDPAGDQDELKILSKEKLLEKLKEGLRVCGIPHNKLKGIHRIVKAIRDKGKPSRKLDKVHPRTPEKIHERFGGDEEKAHPWEFSPSTPSPGMCFRAWDTQSKSENENNKIGFLSRALTGN
jgi:hypothetical protein